jgi:hypothetical protein
VSSKVKVVNEVRNWDGLMRRKDAEWYVEEGRAEWVGKDQPRLVLSHPDNIAAAARARAWEAGYRPSAKAARPRGTPTERE